MKEQQESPGGRVEAELGEDEGLPVLTDFEDGESPSAEETGEDLRAEMERWRDLAFRAKADLENFRKRMAREQEEFRKFANQALLDSLLPVLDNFLLGMESARKSTDPQGVILGMEMVEKQLDEFLRSQNVDPIVTRPGELFDPETQEAMLQEHHPEIPEGAVIKEVRRGYRVAGRLLRPASVIVSRGPEGEESAGTAVRVERE